MNGTSPKMNPTSPLLIQDLRNMVNTQNFDTFLIDAAGVLYTDAGAVQGATEAYKWLKQKGHVYIITNNSYQTPDVISKRFAKSGFDIPVETIITPGLGILYHEPIVSMIKNKNVYIYGQPPAYPYFNQSLVKGVVNSLDEADVIAMMSTYKSGESTHFEALKSHCIKHPNKPVFCCNPDIRVVTYGNTKKPVIGYYAEKLKNETKSSVYMFGKPYKNFSLMVKHMLEQTGADIGLNTCFFDDNLENVTEMMQHIGIHGACIVDTGLSQHLKNQAPNTTAEKQKNLTSIKKTEALKDKDIINRLSFVSKMAI